MIKNLLVLLLTAFLFSAQAQVVFCPEGANWNSAYYSGGFPQSTAYYFPINSYYVGTYMLNTDSVKVLSSGRFFLNGSWSIGTTVYIKQVGDTLFMNTIYTNNQWQVLFNFNAPVGQKWFNALSPSSSQPIISYTTEVISTQTLVINGYTLKQVTVDQSNDNFDDNFVRYTFTERLGSDHFVFTFAGTAHPDGNVFVSHLCYSDNEFGTYYYGGSSCALTTGIVEEKVSLPQLKVFPNPVCTTLTLHSEHKNAANGHYSYSIVNPLGTKVKEGTIYLHEKEATINVEGLANGFYLLALTDRDTNTAPLSTRFIKTN